MIPVTLMRRFPLDVQGRGEGYAHAGAITVVQADAERLDATVQGSTGAYEVRVHAIPGLLRLRCACADAAAHGVCKHLWALLRFADREKLLLPLLDTAGPMAHFGFEHGGTDDEAEGPVPAWQAPLRAMQWQLQLTDAPGAMRAATNLPADRRIVYLVDLDASTGEPVLKVEVGTERRDRDGTWGDVRRYHFSAAAWFNAPDPVDRQIAEMLVGAREEEGVTGMPASGFAIRPRAFGTTLKLICDTGRARLRSSDPALNLRLVKWDDGAPYQLQLRVLPEADGTWSLGGTLQRDRSKPPSNAPSNAPSTMPSSVPFEKVRWLHAAGLALIGDTLVRCEHAGAWPLAMAMRENGSLSLGHDPSPFLEQFHRLPKVPPISLPKGDTLDSVETTPVPLLAVQREPGGWRQAPARLTLRFRYGGTEVAPSSRAPTCFDQSAGVLYRRNTMAERAARARLLGLGAREDWMARQERDAFLVPPPELPALVGTLARDGWVVRMDDRAFHVGALPALVLRSDDTGVDLRGSVAFGPHALALPTLLDAVRTGDPFITLGDDAIGLVSPDELAPFARLLAFGERGRDSVRFASSQLLLLDALLAGLPEVDMDAQLAEARAQLRSFAGIAAAETPPGFQGELRHYQREGLGWFGFLRRFGLGGCLADDMGLGKTIQVLALLEERRTQGQGLSLLVVPRSLVFNWMHEAARFVPGLRMRDLSGADRSLHDVTEDTTDVVLTTYGTLRRDIAHLGARRFDYVVLDEAQAIKNAGTATAKACRLLQARHRLALSGTPIENRVEELWSLFEFLNPGMLGAATRFGAAVRDGAGRDAVGREAMVREAALPDGAAAATATASRDASADSLLARALRPVILRRTKAAVAPELPPRVEQTLEVEMEPKQRAFYEQVRRRAASSVFAQVEREGIAKSRLHILEALLRLRQAACHPALVDSTRGAAPSAKLDALVPALQEIAAEGHKALVFSQFTSFLALLRVRLEEAGLAYEYLDGRTRDRQARVDHFQSAEGPPLFLISLKAGGHGLNLTAAEYVYLLDPWWNPAVEAQAIDRAHRIGQTRHVMATRVVARDTIESKILALQASKRALADAILTEDRGGLTGIGRAELELLLG